MSLPVVAEEKDEKKEVRSWFQVLQHRQELGIVEIFGPPVEH